MTAPSCPRHGPMHYIDGEWRCGPCEAAIERAEDARGDFGHDPTDENRYESWLDEIGGSR